MNFSASRIKSESDNDKETANSFSISPSIGYRFNEKWEVGILLTFNKFNNKEPNYSFYTDNEGTTAEMIINETKTKEYLAGAYVRRQIVRFNKFSVHGLFDIYVGKGNLERSFLLSSGYDYTLWGTNICPVLMFDLSNKFTVFANLNFLNLGLSSSKIKNLSTTTEFNFVVNANDILPAIGLIYKF